MSTFLETIPGLAALCHHPGIILVSSWHHPGDIQAFWWHPDGVLACSRHPDGLMAGIVPNLPHSLEFEFSNGKSKGIFRCIKMRLWRERQNSTHIRSYLGDSWRCPDGFQAECENLTDFITSPISNAKSLSFLPVANLLCDCNVVHHIFRKHFISDFDSH